MIIPFLFFFLILLYAGMQLYLWWFWKKGVTENEHKLGVNWPSVTVLIPVRNEENHIKECLQSVILQSYSRDQLEIVVINDHSTDRTAELVAGFPEVLLIEQKKNFHGKKAALETGIKVATGEIILTTDGDCEVGKDWVSLMVQALMMEGSASLLTGPVWTIPTKPGFLQKYQEIEQASLNVLTYSGLKSGLILSAMGANQAYPRSIYVEVDPYADNKHIPSGDDVFFAQKWNQNGGNVQFVNKTGAMVFTVAANTFSGFLRQRIRWAGKSSGYIHLPTKLYMAIFAASNLSFILLLLAGFWEPDYFTFLLIGLLVKFVVDYLIIYTGMRWGQKTVCWQDVLLASLFQVAYVGYVSFLLVSKRKSQWKEE